MALRLGVNSYVTVPQADSYFQDRLFTEPWDGKPLRQKEQALVMATTKIDRLRLEGEKTYGEGQVLQFPRKLYPRSSARRYFPSPFIEYSHVQTTVPEEVRHAVCEEALALLDYGNNHRIRLQHQGVSSFSTGDGIQESFGAGKGPSSRKKLLSEEAYDLLRPYLVVSVPIEGGGGLF
ncbi:MAG: hypothetical protein M3P49_09655 [Actinomycetota bacterium]|nr:hypothetical protein [Actinomycetota bacterium]